jgi:multidrug resistance efflux pump
VSPGDYVAAGKELVNLEAIDPIKVDLQVPERHAGAIRAGQAITVRVDAFPGREYTGEVYPWTRASIPRPGASNCARVSRTPTTSCGPACSPEARW